MEPIQFFSLDQNKEKIDKSKPWSPIIFPAELPPPPTGQSAAFYDQLGQATANVDDAAYIVRSEHLPPPPGFQFLHGQSQPETIEEWQRVVETHQAALLPAPVPSVQTQPPQSPEEEDDNFTPELERTPQGYLLRYSRRGRKILATNYVIDILSITYQVEVNGEFSQPNVHLAVRVCTESISTELTLAFAQLDTAGQEIAKKVGTAWVVPQAKQSFYKVIGYELRTQLASAQKRYIYTRTGWFTSPSGKWFYAQDGANPPSPELCYQTGFRFGHPTETYTAEELVQFVWKLLSLTRDDELECILVPVLFAHLGILWSLFKEAGYLNRKKLFTLFYTLPKQHRNHHWTAVYRPRGGRDTPPKKK